MDKKRRKRTHTHNFTGEQIAALRNNRYVAAVTASTVRFSEEFKQMIYRRMYAGEKAEDVFRECGIAPEILGQDRIRNFKYMLNQYAGRKSGFADGRKNRKTAGKRKHTISLRLERLEQEYEWIRQEIESLKKVQAQTPEKRK